MKKCVIMGILAFLVGAACGMMFQIEVEIRHAASPPKWPECEGAGVKG